MNTVKIEPSSLEFLKQLKKNNNREWFNIHKDRYLAEHAKIISFAEALLKEMNKHDKLETESGKKSLHRIYKDTRFSTDKTPYKINWSGSFSRATKHLRGGYYFHIEPGNSFIGGGFWNPNPEDLKRIRDEVFFNAASLRKILKSKSFVNTFGTLMGEQVKTTPKGFPSDHPDIDLLRYKQFLVMRKFSDKEVMSDAFLQEANDTFKKMRPFFDFMSMTLTTDLNGISTV